MERPTLLEHLRPIHDPSSLHLGQEVFILTVFASGTMTSCQGHIATMGYAPDGVFFINLRGLPLCLDRPYPVEVHVWEVMWQGPRPEESPKAKTLTEAINEVLDAFGDQIRKLR
jgi:hypothetical protein